MAATAPFDFSEVTSQPGQSLSFTSLGQGGWQVIDVRSEVEFAAGSVPGAVNIPLFDDDERGRIGTIYRYGGREEAVATGRALVDAKLAELLAAFVPYRHCPLAVYCARGGMRSRAVVNLLSLVGYQAGQLAGGYKEYRRLTLACLGQFRPRLIVIHGLTGTGKTRILQRLAAAIDLEELAGHRSSLFGALGRQPNSQQTFESGLAKVVASLGEEPYFIEGESRKIGRVFIPQPLAEAMRDGILVQIHCSLETRVARIIEDYPVVDPTMRNRVEVILRSLTQKLGSRRVEEMCRLLHRQELSELVRILLLEYYDRRYRRGMSAYSYTLELSSEDINEAVARLTALRQEVQRTPFFPSGPFPAKEETARVSGTVAE
jgi:tRNA 2-selenouridine synthase